MVFGTHYFSPSATWKLPVCMMFFLKCCSAKAKMRRGLQLSKELFFGSGPIFVNHGFGH